MLTVQICYKLLILMIPNHILRTFIDSNHKDNSDFVDERLNNEQQGKSNKELIPQNILKNKLGERFLHVIKGMKKYYRAIEISKKIVDEFFLLRKEAVNFLHYKKSNKNFNF